MAADSVNNYTSFLSIANVNHLGGSYSDAEKVDKFNTAKAVSDKLGLPLNIQKEKTQTFQDKQTRLLHVFEATMLEAGHTSLLNAEALGETGAHLRGELSTANLHNIFKDTNKDTRWAFSQNPDGSITPVESTKPMHTFADGRTVPTLNRTELANMVVNHVDRHVTINVVDAVLANTVNSTNLAGRTGYAKYDFYDYLKENAENYVKLAKEKGVLIAKKIPELGAPILAITSLYAASMAASANTTDDTLTKTSKILNAATEDIGGGAARAAVAGDYEKALHKAAELIPVPYADEALAETLRSKEQQAVIDALQKDTATLTSMQSNMKLAPIDRHLAEYQLHYLEAKEHGNLIDGMSAASTLTNLAEMKIKLETQWKAEANTFIAATQYPETDWSQFKKEHPNLAIQADLHTAAQNSGHPQAFVARMDEIIAKNTAQGMPMQPIAQQLSQFSQQQHPANEPVIEQAASR